jgi:hypothetical protein
LNGACPHRSKTQSRLAMSHQELTQVHDAPHTLGRKLMGMMVTVVEILENILCEGATPSVQGYHALPYCRLGGHKIRYNHCGYEGLAGACRNRSCPKYRDAC